MNDGQFTLSERSRSRVQTKREFQKLVLAANDVRTALYTCDALISVINGWNGKTLPFEVSDAFLSTIVVSYARPFTDNKSVGKLPKKWSVFSSPQLQEAHNDILQMRNEVFAHTDSEVHKISLVPHSCLPPELGPKPEQVAYKINRVLLPPTNVIRYRRLCEDLQGRLEDAIKRLLETLYDGLEMPNKSFELRFDDGL